MYVHSFFFITIFVTVVQWGASAPPGSRDSKIKSRNQDRLKDALDPAKNLLQRLEKYANNEDKAKESDQVPKPKVIKKRPELFGRPDHLEAVPLERDGHLNKLFRREAFLGQDTNQAPVWPNGEMGGVESANDVHPEREKSTIKQKDQGTLLTETFYKADTNKDKELSLFELQEWIYQTALRHLNEAVSENRKVYFQQIDSNDDGIVTWEEYHYHFLTDNNLMDPYKAKNHKEEDHADLENDAQDKIELELQKWKEANTDGEDGLTEMEFLAFRHPEHNMKTLKTMVNDIIRNLDKNNDRKLTKEEFAAPPVGEVDEKWVEEEKKYKKEREKEFESEIDLNGDGIATEEELFNYTNPKNPQHARNEAKGIILKLRDTSISQTGGHVRG